MQKKNAEIVREYYELLNSHNLDRIYDYVDRKCVFHSDPYVGIGIRSDEKPGEKIVITEVAENGPSIGKLMVGDEVVSMKDEYNTAETFEELKKVNLGRGQVGIPLNITVRRGEELLTFSVVRSRIDGFDLVMNDDLLESSRKFFTEITPDFHIETKLILEDGNMVASYVLQSGTNRDFHASAIWSSFTIMRLENGKIVETWGLDDDLSWHQQMGYQIKSPSEAKV